ncbi:hypothetical protein Efla_001334 [Eimeria flavescens]
MSCNSSAKASLQSAKRSKMAAQPHSSSQAAASSAHSAVLLSAAASAAAPAAPSIAPAATHVALLRDSAAPVSFFAEFPASRDSATLRSAPPTCSPTSRRASSSKLRRKRLWQALSLLPVDPLSALLFLRRLILRRPLFPRGHLVLRGLILRSPLVRRTQLRLRARQRLMLAIADVPPHHPSLSLRKLKTGPASQGPSHFLKMLGSASVPSPLSFPAAIAGSLLRATDRAWEGSA